MSVDNDGESTKAGTFFLYALFTSKIMVAAPMVHQYVFPEDVKKKVNSHYRLEGCGQGPGDFNSNCNF